MTCMPMPMMSKRGVEQQHGKLCYKHPFNMRPTCLGQGFASERHGPDTRHVAKRISQLNVSKDPRCRPSSGRSVLPAFRAARPSLPGYSLTY